MALTAITNAQIFDGEKAVGVRTVVIDGGRIARVGGDAPEGSEIVDGSGATLLPGLIDAHVHSAPGSLALALRFGVTTELEMQGMNTRENRGPSPTTTHRLTCAPPASPSPRPAVTRVS